MNVVEIERLILRSAKPCEFMPLHNQTFSDKNASRYVLSGGTFTEPQSHDLFEDKFNFGDGDPYGFCVIKEKPSESAVGSLV